MDLAEGLGVPLFQLLGAGTLIRCGLLATRCTGPPYRPEWGWRCKGMENGLYLPENGLGHRFLRGARTLTAPLGFLEEWKKYAGTYSGEGGRPADMVKHRKS